MDAELRTALTKAIGDYYEGYADPEASPNIWHRAAGAVDVIVATVDQWLTAKGAAAGPIDLKDLDPNIAGFVNENFDELIR